MTFLELHQDGALLLINLESIVTVIPAKKGGGSFVTIATEEDPYRVDETIEHIQEMMTVYEVEFMETANDG